MQRGFEYIAEIGRVVIPYGVEVAKVFADPDKGFFISLAGYYALTVIQIRAEDVANQIEALAASVESWDPVSAYENWIRSVTGLGDKPIWELFNPVIAWEEVNAIEALKEVSCAALDVGCWISNALKALAKVLLTPIFFIKNLVLVVSYYVLAGLIAVGKFIAVGFLRYIAKPIATAIVWVYENVRSILRSIFCYYMRIAQVATVGKEVVAGKGSLGRRILKGIAKLFTYAFLTSLLARECSLVPLTPEGGEIVTPPAPVPVVPPVTLTYTATARLWLYAAEKLSREVTVPIYLAVGRVALEASESVVTPTGYYATARITLEASETVVRPAEVEPVTVPTAAVLASADVSVGVAQYSATGRVALSVEEAVLTAGFESVSVPASAILVSTDLTIEAVQFTATGRVSVSASEVATSMRAEAISVPISAVLVSTDLAVQQLEFTATGSLSVSASESASLEVTGFGIVPKSSAIASASLQVS